MNTLKSCRRNSTKRRIIASFILFSFLLTSGMAPVRYAYGQELFQLPQPGMRVSLSPAFTPSLLKGVKVYPDNPFRLDFILDKGNPSDSTEQLESETTRLIKYFLASVTVPEKDLWVNLSPYEKDRIIPNAFGVTEMGRDLLAQDYILKQITASVIYPEEKIGKEFWDKVYAEARKQYGTTDVPIDTFNKVWIVPEKAVVYESKDSAYVVESRLKVLLEEDYLALEKGTNGKEVIEKAKETNKLGSKIVREVVIPILEREVNEGKNFAELRQVYHSLILAIWYKDKIKESLLGKAYVDQEKIGGVDIADKAAKEKIWAQYVEAFKKGAYNYIKEDIDPATQQPVPRKYFSGGFDGAKFREGYEHKFPDRGQLSELAMLSQSSDRKIVQVELDATMGSPKDFAKRSQVVPAGFSKNRIDGPFESRKRQIALITSVVNELNGIPRTEQSDALQTAALEVLDGVGADAAMIARPATRVFMAYLKENPRGETSKAINRPLAVETLAGVLVTQMGEQVQVKTANAEEDGGIEGVIEQIKQERPQVLALSVSFGALRRHLPIVMDYIRSMPSEDRPVVILGNIVASYNVDTILKDYPEVIISTGQGEGAIVDIVKYSRGEIAKAEIRDVVFLEAGEKKAGPTTRESFITLGLGLPSVDSISKVLSSGGSVSLQASRGCPFACLMCDRRQMLGIGWRGKPLEQVIQEVATLADLGVRQINFVDEEFFAGGKDRLKTFADIVIDLKKRGELPSDLTFSTSVSARSIFKQRDTLENNEERKEIVRRLKEAGFAFLFIGTESGSPTQLRRYGKAATPYENEEALKIIEEAGIRAVPGFIMFDPEVTLEELKENISFLRRTGMDKRVTYSLKAFIPMHGIPMSQRLIKKGLIDPNSYDPDRLSYDYLFENQRVAHIIKEIKDWEESESSFLWQIKTIYRSSYFSSLPALGRQRIEDLLDRQNQQLLDFLEEMINIDERVGNLPEMEDALSRKYGMLLVNDMKAASEVMRSVGLPPGSKDFLDVIEKGILREALRLFFVGKEFTESELKDVIQREFDFTYQDKSFQALVALFLKQERLYRVGDKLALHEKFWQYRDLPPVDRPHAAIDPALLKKETSLTVSVAATTLRQSVSILDEVQKAGEEASGQEHPLTQLFDSKIAGINLRKEKAGEPERAQNQQKVEEAKDILKFITEGTHASIAAAFVKFMEHSPSQDDFILASVDVLPLSFSNAIVFLEEAYADPQRFEGWKKFVRSIPALKEVLANIPAPAARALIDDAVDFTFPDIGSGTTSEIFKPMADEDAREVHAFEEQQTTRNDEFLILTRPPGTFSAEFVNEVMKRLALFGYRVKGTRVIGGKFIENNSMFEAHVQPHSIRIAKGQYVIGKAEKDKLLSIYGQPVFQEKFGTSAEEAPVIPVFDLLQHGLTKEETFQLWSEGAEASDRNTGKIDGINTIGEHFFVRPVVHPKINNGHVFFLANGYHFGVEKPFYEPATRVAAIAVEKTDPFAAPLPFMRRYFQGSTDPSRAFLGSVRRDAYDGVVKVEGKVSIEHPVLHMSSSALESVKELVLWMGIDIEQTVFGKKLIEAGYTHEEIQFFVSDPLLPVGDKMVTLFDLVPGADQETTLQALLKYFPPFYGTGSVQPSISYSYYQQLAREYAAGRRGFVAQRYPSDRIFHPSSLMAMPHRGTIEDGENMALGENLFRQGKVAELYMMGGRQGRFFSYDVPEEQRISRAISAQLDVNGQPRSLLELHMRHNLWSQRHYNAALPLWMMTSEMNQEAIEAFIQQNDYFGLPQSQVHFFSQGEVGVFNPRAEDIHAKYPDVPLAEAQAYLDKHQASPGNLLRFSDGTSAVRPPGHFDAIVQFILSGALDTALTQGVQYLYLVDPSDSGALLDPSLVGYMVKHDKEALITFVKKNTELEINLNGKKFKAYIREGRVTASNLPAEYQVAFLDNGYQVVNAVGVIQAADIRAKEETGGVLINDGKREFVVDNFCFEPGYNQQEHRNFATTSFVLKVDSLLSMMGLTLPEYRALLTNKRKLLEHVEKRLADRVDTFVDIKKIKDAQTGEMHYGGQWVRLLAAVSNLVNTANVLIDRDGVETRSGYIPAKSPEDFIIRKPDIMRMLAARVATENKSFGLTKAFPIIPIDGWSGTGKTSLAKFMADSFGYTWLEFSSLFRAASWYAGTLGDLPWEKLVQGVLDQDYQIKEDWGEQQVLVNGHNVSAQIYANTQDAIDILKRGSRLAAETVIQIHMREIFKRMVGNLRARNIPLILSGRTVGIDIAPDARAKFFLSADLGVRATRAGSLFTGVPGSEVLDQLRMRDAVDQSRTESAVQPAPDAVIINTTETALPETATALIAQLLKKKEDPGTGGVDLTRARTSLEVQSEGGGIEFHMDPSLLDQLRNSSGLTPVIIGIYPMTTSVPMFLGLNDGADKLAAVR